MAPSKATHLVGGEFGLKHLSADSFQVDLTLYFDFINGNPGAIDFSTTAAFYRKSDNALMEELEMPLIEDTAFVPYANPACSLSAPVQTKIYRYRAIIELSALRYGDAQGYYMSWMRCCRNSVITNLIDPGNTGQVYYLSFPARVLNGAPFTNSSPGSFKPLTDYGCLNQLYEKDFSGIDPDGDSLDYRLTVPYGFNSGLGSRPPSTPEPYDSVTWESGYNRHLQITGSVPLTIDARTGRLSVRPDRRGLFVFAVECREYRNGVLIGYVRRDFQLYVDDCQANVAPRIGLTSPTGSPVAERDTVTVVAGSAGCVPILVRDTTDSESLRFVSTAFTQAELRFNPLSGTTSPGSPFRASLCVQGCQFAGATTARIGLIRIIAMDGGCPQPKMDTIDFYLRVLPPVRRPPVIDVSLSNGPFVRSVPRPITIRNASQRLIRVRITDSANGVSLNASIGPGNNPNGIEIVSSQGVGTTQALYAFRVKVPCHLDSNQIFTLTLLGQSQFCASSYFDTLTIPIRSLPPRIKAGGDSTVCLGVQASLAAVRRLDSLRWNTGDTGRLLVTPRAGLYWVEGQDFLGCKARDSISVLDRVPAATRIAGRPLICQGGQAVFMATRSSGTRLRWSNGDTSASIRILSPGLLKVKATRADGCLAFDSLLIRPAPIPLATIAGPTRFCEGDTARLSASATGGSHFQWSTGDTTARIQRTVPGLLIVTATDTIGCRGRDTVLLQMNPLPRPRILGNLAVCPDGTNTLRLAQGYFSRVWSTGDTGLSTQATQPGTVWVKTSDSYGCSSGDSVVLISAPTPSLALSGPDYFCQGDVVNLFAPSGLVHYRWSTGDTTRSIDIQNSGTYHVQARNRQGCLGEDSITLRSRPKPVVDISAPSQFCYGIPTQIGVRQNLARYEWNTGDRSQTISITNGGRYIAQGWDTNGCKNADTVLVNRVRITNVRIEAPPGICPGGTVNLLAVAAGRLHYQWSTSADDTSRYAIATSPGHYEVQILDTNGCHTSAFHDLAAFTNPVPHISGSVELCPGAVGTLMLSDTFASYLWGGHQITRQIRIVSPGFYRVQVANRQGCVGVDSITVASAPSPVPGLADHAFFCPGGSVSLVANPSQGHYQWNTGDTSSAITISQPGRFTCTVRSLAGCLASDTVVAELYLRPNFTIEAPRRICPRGSAGLRVTGGLAHYLWNTGDSTPTLIVDHPGVFTVEVTDAQACRWQGSLNLPEAPPIRPRLQLPERLCEGVPVVLNAEPVLDSASYRWQLLYQGGQTLDTVTPSPTLLVSRSFIARLTVRDKYHCSDTASWGAMVAVPQIPPFDFVDSAFCAPASITLAMPDVPETEYRWLDDTGRVYSANREAPFASSGHYLAKAKNSCLTKLDEFTIIANPSPKPITVPERDTTLCLGTELKWQVGLPATDSLLSFGSELGQELSVVKKPNSRIQFTYRNPNEGKDTLYFWAINQSGCRTKSVYSIRSELCGSAMFMPTAFSPQGDEQNDTLKLRGFQVSQAHLVIFNNWGEIVFECNRFNAKTQLFEDSWLGSYKGEPSPVGVYKYYLTFKGINAMDADWKKQKGEIMLLR